MAGADVHHERRPALGYALVVVAVLLFAVNGAVSKVLLVSGLSSLRLTEVRCTGALAGLLLVLAGTGRGRPSLRARELPLLVAFGVGGLVAVQLLYFVAIRRIPIGIALLVQYVAPVLVALWARYVLHEPVRRRIWAALALSLAGLSLIVEVWSGVELDGIGVTAALGAALAYAVYVLLAEHGVARRDPISLSAYGFLFASLFWAIVQPWWSFPAGVVGDRVSLLGNLAGTRLPVWALISWMVVLGTIVPFALIASALRHVSATRASILAMIEPVAGALVAYLWLGESLSAVQLTGGGIVLGGILLAQTAR